MPPVQPALLSLEPHVHVLTETCPTCDQPIPNEKAHEIRARAAALQKRLTDEADARAAQKIAAEKAQIEEAAKTRIEQAEREKAEAVKKANAEATAKIEAAKAEGISESCKVAGIPTSGIPLSRMLLVNSSTNNGTPSVRSTI